jgi:hypothetical protein
VQELLHPRRKIIFSPPARPSALARPPLRYLPTAHPLPFSSLPAEARRSPPEPVEGGRKMAKRVVKYFVQPRAPLVRGSQSKTEEKPVLWTSENQHDGNPSGHKSRDPQYPS